MPLLWVLDGDSITAYKDLPAAESQSAGSFIYWATNHWYIHRTSSIYKVPFWATVYDHTQIPPKYRAMVLLLT